MLTDSAVAVVYIWPSASDLRTAIIPNNCLFAL